MDHNSYGLETNPFFLAGEGYAGHYIPAIFQAVNTNAYHHHYYRTLKFRIRGVILGGGWVDPERQGNHYDSVVGAAGIVSQRNRNITQDNANKGIIKIKNSLYSQVRPFFN
jgi:carboxypeptidase C (cathepsin A)